MKNSNSRKLELIVILGMHRSGTSAITRGLEVLGVELGDNLMPLVADNNSKGFFEDLDVVNFNISLLDHLGMDWHYASPVTDAHVADLTASGYLLKAADLIRHKIASKRPYGIKDPRLSKLIPFWKKVFEHCELDVGYVIAIRNPISVAKSLNKRDGLPFEKSYLLWLDHVLAALIQTEGTNRVVVDFDLVIKNSAKQLDRLADAFDLSVNSDAMTEYALQFLDEKLRHNIDQPQDLAIDPRISPLVCELYSILREAAATGRPFLMNEGQLAYFEKSRDNICCSIVFIDRLHQAVADRDGQLVTLNQTVADRDGQLATLNQTVADRDGQLATLNQTVADRDGQLAMLKKAIQEQDGRISLLEHNIFQLSENAQNLTLVVQSAKRWQKRSWAKRAFHRWRAPGEDRYRINFLKRLELSFRRRRDHLLKRSSNIQRKKNDSESKKSGMKFIQALAFHYSGKPRGWVRFLIFHKNRKPRLILKRIACKKSGLSRKAFFSWMHAASPSLIRSGRTYGEGIKQLDELTMCDRRAMESNIKNMKEPPIISVVMPTYNTKPEWLHKAICSVQNQTYPHWQLCIADDASTASQVREILQHYCALDSRIRVAYRTVCGNISAASNSALELATGDFVALLDHDDTLEPHALERCAETIITTAADVIYTDQDTTTDDGRVLWTFYKPAWSPEYLRHVMYVGHLLVVRSTLVKRLGGFRSEFDGVQDFEFMLRLSEATNKIVHISEVLYHWHAVDGSIAASTTAKAGIADKQVRAVQSYLDRNAISAIATKHPTLPHRCRIKPVLKTYPKVSIIIPSKDQADIIKVCLDSIYAKTTYPDFEVIVVDSGTTQPEALAVLASHPVRVVPLERQFNFSAACNLGAKKASGVILVFLNNDTEVITEDWLEHLVFHLTADDVGAVGPLLLYPNGKVQHAGVVLGARGTADHVARHFPADSDGYAGSLSCPHEVSAVTGACLAINKSTFLDIEAFSELYGTHYQDVDLCLKLRQRSLRCIFTPEARLFHHESISRGQNSYDFLDRLLLMDSWREVLLASDPYYPKQFSLDRLDYSMI